MSTVAAIDCGTNSIRLLIADNEGDSSAIFHDLTRQMRVVRLGRDVDRTGMLSPQGIAATLEATREYQQLIEQFGAEKIRFVATSASRDASNGDEFIAGVKKILGVEPEIISGKQEAALSFAGAASAVPAEEPRPLLVVDIGGGSTEFVLGNQSVEQSISIDMGSVRVTERFLSDVSPSRSISSEQEKTVINWIDRQLDRVCEAVNIGSIRTLVGVAGTVTTITAHALGLQSYMPERTHGAHVNAVQLEPSIRFMVEQPAVIKGDLAFMPKGREDVIAAGALIWSRIIARVGEETAAQGKRVDTTVMSEHDILDGIALSML